jgi:hypothetical protein
MESWLAAYEDRGTPTRTVESRTALDAAKDFALLTPRGDDCTVVVSPTADPEKRLFFERHSGVFSERLPPPALPPEPAPPAAPPASVAIPATAPSTGKDTYSHRGWLTSDSFLKRSLAAAGYTAVGHLLVAVAVWLLFLGAMAGCLSLAHLLGQR